MRRLLRLLILALFLATALASSAYDFVTKHGLRWADGNIPMSLQLDETLDPFPMLDGHTSWNDVAKDALGLWNAQLTRVQFTTFHSSTRGDGDHDNEVFFSSTIYGHAFGGLVLAVTTAWHIGSERVEADTLFNDTISWDSYRGPIDYNNVDLRRVAAHEFGHNLGLDHPDAAHQINVALMNSIVSDLDTLAPDDIRGAKALYPPNARVALNVQFVPPGSGTVTMVPPPDLTGKYQAGTLVTITAKAQRRFRFNFWGGDELATGTRLRVLAVENENITANFSTNKAPVVAAASRSQFASGSDDVTLTSRAHGTGPLKLQWQHDGADMPDATNATLHLYYVSHDDSGLYSLRATNASGATYSKPARVVVDGY